MTEQPGPEQTAPDASGRPDPADDRPADDAQTAPQDAPAAGGTDDGPPAQGEGAPDSW